MAFDARKLWTTGRRDERLLEIRSVTHLAAFMLPAGNYSVFEKTAAERLRNTKSKIEAQEAHRKHVQARPYARHLHWMSAWWPCC